MDVSIIIVNYNTLQMTSECIDSVIEKTEGISYEIILVDNASTDGSKEFFEKDDRIKYIYLDENIGFGRANNVGFQYSTGDYIFLLNSDTLLINNAVKILCELLRNHPKIAICGGQLLNQSSTPTHSYAMFLPSIKGEIDIFLNNLISKLIKLFYVNIKKQNQYFKVGYITGADMMIRRLDLDEIGIFDERFFMYFEETEFSYRFKKANKQIAFCPKAKIFHLQGASFKISDFQETTYNKSRKIYYNIIYPNWKFKLVNLIYGLTCLSRIIVFKATKNEQKKYFWSQKYKYFRQGLNNKYFVKINDYIKQV